MALAFPDLSLVLQGAMARSYRIEGYAIVSADGMIANADGIMPPELKVEADQQFFANELDRATLVVHGRDSYENQPNSPQRHRLILTRKVAATAPDPENPKALLWNPAGLPFEAAWTLLGPPNGGAAIIGGTGVFTLFLDIGYDAFHLSRVSKVKLPGGRPCFSQVRYGRIAEDVLAQFGLEPGPMRVLDAEAAATLVTWKRRSA
jgi:dihydrofolate reductase